MECPASIYQSGPYSKRQVIFFPTARYTFKVLSLWGMSLVGLLAMSCLSTPYWDVVLKRSRIAAILMCLRTSSTEGTLSNLYSTITFTQVLEGLLCWRDLLLQLPGEEILISGYDFSNDIWFGSSQAPKFDWCVIHLVLQVYLLSN